MENLKNKRILAIIGLSCMFLGTILPFITLKILGISTSTSLWKYWEGKIVLLLLIINALFIFKDYIKKYVPQMFNSGFGKMLENLNSKLSIIPTLVAVAFVLYLTFNLNVDGKYIKFGFGFYVLWLGVIALVGHSILYKGNGVEQSVVIQNPVSNQNNSVSANEAIQSTEVSSNVMTQNEQPEIQQNVENSSTDNLTTGEQKQVVAVTSEHSTPSIPNSDISTNEAIQSTEVSRNVVTQNEQPEVQQNVEVTSTDNLNTVEQNIDSSDNQVIDNGKLDQSNTKVCPKCGKEVDLNVKFCPTCGYNFE